MTEQIQTQTPNAGSGAAMLFFKELMENVETLTGIADLHGARTLADVMYLQNAILDGTFIELYPDESAVLKVVDDMPSAAIWRQFIQVPEVEGVATQQESSLLSQAKQLVSDIAAMEQRSIMLRADTPNEILEMLLFQGEPTGRSRKELEDRFTIASSVPYLTRWLGEDDGSQQRVAIAVGQRRWHLNYRQYVLITGSRYDMHGTWWQYCHDDGTEGECFAVLLAIRSDAAGALGFDTDEMMRQHAKWLVRKGSKLYLDWAAKLIPSTDIALVD